jgi:signal transduction histidine kinase
MVRFLGLLFISLMLSLDAWAGGRNGCLECHNNLQGRMGEIAKSFAVSIHAAVGLSCDACHGGNASAVERDQAKAPGTGYHPSPAFAEIPELCGSCHSAAKYMKHFNPTLRIDQVSEYLTSVHGQRSFKGDTKVATCTSCHATHDIRRTSDPQSPANRSNVAATCGRCHSDTNRMRPYAIRTNQLALYLRSKHGVALKQRGDVSAPTCTDCHGSHGSVPPAAGSIVNVCSHCHGREVELFKKSAHYPSFMSEKRKACIGCHESHGPEAPENALFSGMTGGCITCHGSDEAGGVAEQLGHGGLALKNSISFSRKFLVDAAQAGVDVKSPMELMERASAVIGTARREIHALDDSEITSLVGEGRKLSESAYQQGMHSLEQGKIRSSTRVASFALVALFVLLSGVLVARSVAERRRSQEALRLEQERINLSRERLARIGEISSGVAHSIRNPLHGVLNCVDLLNTRLGKEHPHQPVLSLMSEGLHRIQSVTQRLLDLTREAPLRKAPADIKTLIEETVRFIEVRCHKKGLGLHLDVAEIRPVEVDANQLGEALLNVIDNALDATPSGGTISIKAFLARAGGEFLHIEVQDSGMGIAEEDLPRVFNPFFTTKPVGEGTGLGLAISKRIVEEHGGRIRLESVPGKGTTIEFVVPIFGHESRETKSERTQVGHVLARKQEGIAP